MFFLIKIKSGIKAIMCSPLSVTLRQQQTLKYFLSRSFIRSLAYKLPGGEVHLNSLNRFYSRAFSTSGFRDVPLTNSVNDKTDNACCGFMSIRGFKSSAIFQYALNEEILGKSEKVMQVKLKATRLDAVLKAGLGLSRNKIEKAVYDDRVRVNGKRPTKKSQTVYEGDEIDIVRGYNELNPEKFIDVSRVEIEELRDVEDDGAESDSDDDERIPAKLRRNKLLTIRNYKTPWRGSSSE